MVIENKEQWKKKKKFIPKMPYCASCKSKSNCILRFNPNLKIIEEKNYVQYICIGYSGITELIETKQFKIEQIIGV